MVMFDPNVQIEQKCDFKTRYHVIQQKVCLLSILVNATNVLKKN